MAKTRLHTRRSNLKKSSYARCKPSCKAHVLADTNANDGVRRQCEISMRSLDTKGVSMRWHPPYLSMVISSQCSRPRSYSSKPARSLLRPWGVRAMASSRLRVSIYGTTYIDSNMRALRQVTHLSTHCCSCAT